MTKNKKIIFGVLALMLLIYFLPIFGVEKSVVKNKIAKATREPVLGKRPLRHTIDNLIGKKHTIDFVNELNLSHYVKDENISKIKNSKENVFVFERLDYVEPEKIKELSETFYNFLQSSNGDARYFKPNFDELFTKKVGDIVTIIIDNEEFVGIIEQADIEYPTEKEIKNGESRLFYNFNIQPTLDNYSTSINIHGPKNAMNGSIDYSRQNGGTSYEFRANEEFGIIVPSFDFQDSLGPTLCGN